MRFSTVTQVLALVVLAGCNAIESNLSDPGMTVARVSPDSTTLTPGQSAQFTAYSDNPQTGNASSLPVTWSASGGTISSQGVYTADDADGLFEVIATDLSGRQARARIWKQIGIRDLIMVPAVATVATGGSLQFRSYGVTARGDSLGLNVVYRATGGAISTSGLYTAGQVAGTFRVIASAGQLADTSSVTVSTTQPPPTTGVAECASAQPEWIWCDDFEQNRLGSYFEYDNGGGNFTRNAAVGFNGSNGMRAHFNVGTQAPGALHLAFGSTPGAYFRPIDAGTTKYREIYWRMYVKFQSGWTGGGGDKLSRAIVFANSSFAQAAIGHVWSGTAPNPSTDYLVVDPASGTDASGNLRTTQYNDFANLTWLGQGQSSVAMFDASHVGQWYCVEAHMKLNSAGNADGVLESWINGNPEGRRSGLNFLGSYSDYGINAIYFENYWGAGSIASQDRFFDNIVVSTSRIGCTS